MTSNTLISSARNQFVGSVESILNGPVSAELSIRVATGCHVVATITHASVESLGLEVGSEVVVLIKSSSVMLATEVPGARYSARNQLCGAVSSVTDGPVNSEVNIDLGDQMGITAVITHASRDLLQLQTGSRICALFKASSVILARP